MKRIKKIENGLNVNLIKLKNTLKRKRKYHRILSKTAQILVDEMPTSMDVSLGKKGIKHILRIRSEIIYQLDIAKQDALIEVLPTMKFSRIKRKMMRGEDVFFESRKPERYYKILSFLEISSSTLLSLLGGAIGSGLYQNHFALLIIATIGEWLIFNGLINRGIKNINVSKQFKTVRLLEDILEKTNDIILNVMAFEFLAKKENCINQNLDNDNSLENDNSPIKLNDVQAEADLWKKYIQMDVLIKQIHYTLKDREYDENDLFIKNEYMRIFTDLDEYATTNIMLNKIVDRWLNGESVETLAESLGRCENNAKIDAK